MDPAKLLQALREETLPKLQPARAAVDKARASGNASDLKAARELMHKVAGTAAMAGLSSLSRLGKLGEDVALLAIEGEAQLTKRLFGVLDGVLSAIALELEPVTTAKLPAHEPTTEVGAPGRGRVIVASDEVVSGKLMVKLLEEQGFSVRKVSLADAAERLPDCELLLLDVPAKAGSAAHVEDALVNGTKRHLPVVVTAKSDDGGKLAARAAAVLTKPVAPEALEQAVRSLVERRLAVAAARAKAPTGQVPQPAPASQRQLRVLVVDDSRVIRGVVREALAEVGALTVEAADGGEALAAFDAERPDAVISDLQMPGVDGTQLIPLLRGRGGPRVPIVVLSALEDEASRRAGLAAGADAYLVKSVIDGPALMRALKAAGLPL